MKKTLLLSFLAVTAAFLFISCNDEKEELKVTEFNPLSGTVINVDKNGGLQEFRYEIVNPTESGVVEAVLQSGIDWITDINTTSQYGVVTFNVALSEVEEPREATITLTYENLEIELTVHQSEGEVIPAFTITVQEIDYRSAKWDVSAKDDEMTYLNMIVDKTTWDSFGTFDEFLAYNLEELSKNTDGFTLEDYLRYQMLKTGDQTGVTVTGLAPETEYVVYAVGLTAEQEVLSEHCMTTCATEPIPMVDAGFTIEAEPTMSSIAVTITPDNKEVNYLYGLEEGTGFTAEEISYLCQMAINEEILFYQAISGSMSIADIIDMISKLGEPAIQEFTGLSSETGYTVYAVYVDRLSGYLNSEPVLKEVTTLEETGDWYSTLTSDYTLNLEGAVATAVNYGDYYRTGGNNWQIKIKPADGVSCDELDTEIVVNSLNFEDEIPDGTYKAAADNGDPMPGEFLTGEYFYGYLYTWYKGDFGADGKPQSVAPGTGGSITFTKNSDGTYTVEFSFQDDRSKPRTFSGSWTGVIEFSNRY